MLKSVLCLKFFVTDGVCVRVYVSVCVRGRGESQEKKNGATRLDPWEIFVLLPLKIPFHFISLRKLKNYLQFYMRIAFKLNRTKKKVHHKFEIAFNFKKEIPLKCFLSPLGDTLSPSFYIRNSFKFIWNKK